LTSKEATVVISSAGRRLYLIDWLREAFEALGIDGRVVVAENDATSSSASYGDVARRLPKYTDRDYGPELLRLADDVDAKIFISLNDYELMHIHVNTGLAESIRRHRVLVHGVSYAWQYGCADMIQFARLIISVGVPSQSTITN